MKTASVLLALGLSKAAFGQYTNQTSNPIIVGAFEAVGCLRSTDGFISFELIVSTQYNSLEFCAASCPATYFGTYKTDCYCGTELDDTVTKVAPTLCNARCPGNLKESCGGQLGVARRQVVPLTELLSVYKRPEGNAATSGLAGVTVTAVVTPVPTQALTTYTSTFTSTTTGTITACPATVTDCPVGQLTTEVVTATTTFCPAATQTGASNPIVCYGNYCAPQTPCPTCPNQRVVCESGNCHTEECSTPQWNQLVVCQGNECNYANNQGAADCNTKVMCLNGNCAQEKCYGDECQKKLVCTGDSCSHQACSGDDCYQKETCTSGSCETQPACPDTCSAPPPMAAAAQATSAANNGVSAPANGGSAPVNGGSSPVNGGSSPVNGGSSPVNGGSSPANGGSAPVTPATTGGQSSPYSTPAVVVGAAGKALPAVGVTIFGVVAGVAFFL